MWQLPLLSTIGQINFLEISEVKLIGLLIIFCMGQLGVTVIIFWLITGRYFDKKLPGYAKSKRSLEYKENPWFARGMNRARCYGSCLLYKNLTKKDPYFKAMFDGYDFRKNARKIDLVLGSAVFVSAITICALMFIHLFLRIFFPRLI